MRTIEAGSTSPARTLGRFVTRKAFLCWLPCSDPSRWCHDGGRRRRSLTGPCGEACGEVLQQAQRSVIVGCGVLSELKVQLRRRGVYAVVSSIPDSLGPAPSEGTRGGLGSVAFTRTRRCPEPLLRPATSGRARAIVVNESCSATSCMLGANHPTERSPVPRTTIEISTVTNRVFPARMPTTRRSLGLG